ncbi:MAG TPA: protein translocase subunit SecF [Candidatus Polarisedimenticolia bacterium]|nr:protein translocase subunit SecF [Candidatus Polarisedimenticolia bacterium]
MLQVFTNANFPMMGRVKWIFLAFSTLAVGVSVATMLTRGFNYGIDFAGGTAVRLKFRERPPIEEMRTALERSGLGDITIQSIGDVADNEVLVRVELPQSKGAAPTEGGEISRRVLEALQTPEARQAQKAGTIDLNMISESDLKDWLGGHLPAGEAGKGQDAAAIAAAVVAYRTGHAGLLTSPSEIGAIPGVGPAAAGLLREKALLGPFTVRSVDFIGPTAGKELLRNTLLAVFGSVFGILLYVWFRFKRVMWGVTSVIALVHDVVIAAGAVSLTRKEFSVEIVAALLTILGYSINDTIVVFDRIRENLRLYRDVDFETLVNASINQTLSRTILTSFTVFIAITALYLYGGDKLNPLSFCLMVGVVFGTYSSVYVAAALLVIVYKRFGAKHVTI